MDFKDVDGKPRPFCPQCGRVVYYDPKVSAVAIVHQDAKVLLVRRGTEPGMGLWSLPGGYVDRGEVVEQAAAREVLEETGVEVEVGNLMGLFSEAGHTVILAVYDTRWTAGTPEAGPEVLDVSLFAPNDLPPLAFPRDREILDMWRQRTGH